MIYIVAVIAILLLVIYFYNSTEGFTVLQLRQADTNRFDRNMSVYTVNTNKCTDMCDNLNNCNSSYYNPTTQKCYLNFTYDNTEMYYSPTNKIQNYFTPSKYKLGKTCS